MNIASALGLRQIFPRQTKSTRFFADSAVPCLGSCEDVIVTPGSPLGAADLRERDKVEPPNCRKQRSHVFRLEQFAGSRLRPAAIVDTNPYIADQPVD